MSTNYPKIDMWRASQPNLSIASTNTGAWRAGVAAGGVIGGDINGPTDKFNLPLCALLSS